MTILYAGDPHVKFSNIEESEKLLNFVLSSARENKVDRIVILGDLYHTMSVIRMEVEHFWLKWLEILSNEFETIVLVGNHDQNGNYSSNFHSLEVFKKLKNSNLKIIDVPTKIGVFAYAPYFHDQESFVASVNKLAKNGAEKLICHQTFSGAKYDNGMYAPDGFDPDLLDFDQIISGHIHLRHRFGKIIYPGNGTWQTQSDANQEKGLWLVNHAEDGSILSEKFLNTSYVVTQILSVIWEEGQDLPIIPDNAKVTVELIGSSDWINIQKRDLKGKYALKTKITDKIDRSTRKPGKSFQDFVSNIFTTNTDRSKLLEYMRNNGII